MDVIDAHFSFFLQKTIVKETKIIPRNLANTSEHVIEETNMICAITPNVSYVTYWNLFHIINLCNNYI